MVDLALPLGLEDVVHGAPDLTSLLHHSPAKKTQTRPRRFVSRTVHPKLPNTATTKKASSFSIANRSRNRKKKCKLQIVYLLIKGIAACCCLAPLIDPIKRDYITQLCSVLIEKKTGEASEVLATFSVIEHMGELVDLLNSLRTK